jgi:ADP-ribosylation factor-binding protein GGA
MRVKLQPLSGNVLPAYKPFIPPPVITQVMLIARNVNKTEKVRLKYKFSYSINNETHTDVGEIDSLFDNCENS